MNEMVKKITAHFGDKASTAEVDKYQSYKTFNKTLEMLSDSPIIAFAQFLSLLKEENKDFELSKELFKGQITLKNEDDDIMELINF